MCGSTCGVWTSPDPPVCRLTLCVQPNPSHPLLSCRLATGLDGVRVESRGHISTLTFFNVSEKDYGNYTCVATNKLGNTNASITLYGECRRPGRGAWRGGGFQGLGREEGAACLACVRPQGSTPHLRCERNSTAILLVHGTWCVQGNWYLLVSCKVSWAPHQRSKPSSEPSCTMVTVNKTEPWNRSIVVLSVGLGVN